MSSGVIRPSVIDKLSRRTTTIFSKLQRQSKRQLAAADVNRPLTEGSPRATTPKAFQKSSNFRKDTAVLYTAYLLEETSVEFKSLLYSIFAVLERDKAGQGRLADVLEECTRLCVLLMSSVNFHSPEASDAISAFTSIIDEIGRVGSDGRSLDSFKAEVASKIQKIKSEFLRNRDARECINSSQMSLSYILDATLDSSIRILTVLQQASSLVPIPALQPALGGIIEILKTVSETRSNYNEMNEIAATAAEFVLSCAIAFEEARHEKGNYECELQGAMNKFTAALEEIVQQCKELSQLNPLTRFLRHTSHTGSIQGIRDRLDLAIKRFQIAVSINIKVDTEALKESFGNLPTLPDYKYGDYFDGTRDDEIADILNWAYNTTDSVLWIHGAAGIGKSTMAQRLIEIFRADERLGGSVFLTPLTTEPASSVVRMIARQLGHMHPRSIAGIAEAAKKINNLDPLRNQITEYLINPIRLLRYPYQIVIVIDGLDEWSDGNLFLEELVGTHLDIPFKLIITSRSTQFIQAVIEDLSISVRRLTQVSQDVVERYLRHVLKSDVDWKGKEPTEDQIQQLAFLADGLLIWAAQVRSMLANELVTKYPHEILDQILFDKKIIDGTGGKLEQLYHSVLSNLVPPEKRPQLRDFLAAVMVLQEPLPIRDFADLLDIPQPLVKGMQRRLAVMQMHGDPEENIISPAGHRYHISFLEFIKSIVGLSEFPAIVMSDAHSDMAQKCLTVASRLVPSVQRSLQPQYNLDDLSQFYQYALKHWPAHVSGGQDEMPNSLSAVDLHGWATLFLPLVSSNFKIGSVSFERVPRDGLLFQVAMSIGNSNVSTLPYHIQCLQVNARLHSDDIATWKALTHAYSKRYRDDRGLPNLTTDYGTHAPSSFLTNPVEPPRGVSSSRGTVENNGKIENKATTLDANEGQRKLLQLLAKNLGDRYEERGDKRDLDESISLHQEALELCPTTHPDRPRLLGSLGYRFLRRVDLLGSRSDIEEGISVLRQALQYEKPANPGLRAIDMNNLSCFLRQYSAKTGEAAFLEEAISLSRKSIALAPADAPNVPKYVALAISLRMRHRLHGKEEDLDESIDLYRREVVGRSIPSDKSYSTWLQALISLLEMRYNLRKDKADLDELIGLRQKAKSHLDETIARRRQELEIRTSGPGQGSENEEAGQVVLNQIKNGRSSS